MSLLAATDLEQRFGERTLFEGLSFELADGETLAVLGPSGSGKSTLLRLLAGLDPLAQGEVRLDGRTMAQWGSPAWRVEVRFVPQRVPTLMGTPAALVQRAKALKSWGGRTIDDPVARAEGWALPPEAWDQPWHELSGGEQQRVLLAVGLTAEPRVLLLDEPTSALDGGAAAAVEAELAGRTKIWVTHDLTQAERVADRVIRLGEP